MDGAFCWLPGHASYHLTQINTQLIFTAKTAAIHLIQLSYCMWAYTSAAPQKPTNSIIKIIFGYYSLNS